MALFIPARKSRMEYLDEAYTSPNASSGTHPSLLPAGTQPYERAIARLTADKINRHLIPSFYRYLQAQDADSQSSGASEFLSHLSEFTSSLHPTGPFWGGDQLGWVDVTIAPWAFRATNVLRHFRGFEIEQAMKEGGRYHQWQKAVFGHPAFKATTSTEELYLDS